MFTITPFAESETVQVRPNDTGAALVNPQMGWTFHYYSNAIERYGSQLEPSDTIDEFPGLSCIYLRLPWGFIEEKEGEFNWSIVDTPAQRWIDKGLQVAFRFSCSESWTRYATPKWVEEAGAKGYNFEPGKLKDDGPYWEPVYNDPIFLEKLDHFLAAAAARYDGNPNVAFIDIGSLGVWGEGHTDWSTTIKYPIDVLRKHVDLHSNYFKKTLIAINDDFTTHGDDSIFDYAFQKGMTLRDDSILVEAAPNHFYSANFAQRFWPSVPVVLENEHYGKSQKKGNWGDGSGYLEAIEKYHAAYASIHWWPREFLNEQRALIDKINLRLGYRLQLKEISWPKTVSLKEPFAVAMKWSNAGVAPCYPGGFIVVTLKDAKGGIVSVFTNEAFDVKSLLPGSAENPPIQEIIQKCQCPRNMKPGQFDVFVSVGQRDGTPVIALPLDNSDNHRRYKVGSIQIL